MNLFKDKTVAGLSLLAFLASMAGIVIAFMLMKEDVISTAHTLNEFFPTRYGVTPSSTWEGSIILGLFTTVLQIVAASTAFSNNVPSGWRWLSAFLLVAGCVFDNWTDVVFRSAYLTGNITVAIVTTVSFYTAGSELLQSFSLLIFFSYWRRAISDLMWGIAMLRAGLRSILSEWTRYISAADRKEKSRPTHADSGYSQLNYNPQRNNQQGNNTARANTNTNAGRGNTNQVRTGVSTNRNQGHGQGTRNQINNNVAKVATVVANEASKTVVDYSDPYDYERNLNEGMGNYHSPYPTNGG